MELDWNDIDYLLVNVIRMKYPNRKKVHCISNQRVGLV